MHHGKDGTDYLVGNINKLVNRIIVLNKNKALTLYFLVDLARLLPPETPKYVLIVN